MQKQFIYDYPMASLAVDILVHDFDKKHVLFIKRKNEPFQDMLALPGGYVNENEEIEVAALRELNEETGLNGVLKELCCLTTPNRDTRGRVISFVYTMGCKLQYMKDAVAMDDAKSIHIMKVSDIAANANNFAFDHYKAVDKFLFPEYSPFIH